MILIEKHFKQIAEQIQKLPCRLNFKIGEVSEILSTSNHVLRYWEKEYPSLKPQKFTNNQRLYTRKDISTLMLIKALLYKEKFSTQGLKKHLPYYLNQMNVFFNGSPFNKEALNQTPLKKTKLKDKTSKLEQKAQDMFITLSNIKKHLEAQ